MDGRNFKTLRSFGFCLPLTSLTSLHSCDWLVLVQIFSQPFLYHSALSVAATGPRTRGLETVCTYIIPASLRRTGSENHVASTPTSSARCRFRNTCLHFSTEHQPAVTPTGGFFLALILLTTLYNNHITIISIIAVFNLSTFFFSPSCLECSICCCRI